MKFLNMVVCVFLWVALFSGCVSINSSENKEDSISFENENGILVVSNETAEGLVLFAGNPAKNTVLGGIRAQETRGFDLCKIPDIPAKGAFLVRAVTFETYNEKSHVTLDDVVYTGLVVYDLENTDDRVNFLISDYIDTTRQSCIYVDNDSLYFVLELHLGNPQGDIVATLPPSANHEKIYLSILDYGMRYDIFPVFVYINPTTGEKNSVFTGKRIAVAPGFVGESISILRISEPENTNMPIEDAPIQLFNE